MKQPLFSITALVFLLLSGIGAGRAMAAAITIPTAEGTFVDWNNATGNGFNVENGGANVGSTGASTVITFDVVNPTEGDYMISFKTGTKNEAKLGVSLTDQTGNTMVEKTVDVVNTNSWTPSTQHNISVMQLPAGNYTLQLKVTETTGNYAGNYGDLAITSLADFDKAPGTISLAKGVYSGCKTENDNANVGYITNGCSATYTFLCAEAGVYKLNADIARYASDGKLAVVITDSETGVEQSNTTFNLTADMPRDYTTQTFELAGRLTEGLKTMTLSFANAEGGFICNYKNLVFEKVKLPEGLVEMALLTVDAEAVSSQVVNVMNTAPYSYTFTDRTYTALPKVKAVFADGSELSAKAELSGTTATYTMPVETSEGTRNYTLVIEGVHIYNKVEADRTVQLKYTSDGKVGDGNWTNGVYTLETAKLDGWNGSSFKLNSAENRWAVPANIVVKQIVFKDFAANYNPGTLKSVSSDGAAAYIPHKHDYTNPNTAGYDCVVNIDGHKAGAPIDFVLEGGGQPVAWFELVVEEVAVATAPQLKSQSVTPTDGKNHCVVALTFDREMQSAEATIDGRTITAEGGATTLYFPVWNLQYSADYTFTLPAGAAKDNQGNATAEDITIAIKVGKKAVADKAAYDFVVGTADEFKAALAAVNEQNKAADAPRKTIFIKNGDYDFGTEEQRIYGYNVSLIGESRDGVVLHGLRDGISNPVLNLRDRTGFYLQDLTVRNDYDYGITPLKGVAVAVYGGNKTIMKNVRMLSNQDTQVTGERAYLEDCEIHGTVDFICGGGDNFFNRARLVMENRGGNCIAAPSTNATAKWGYVFNECVIERAEGATEVVDGGYTLGRPWQNEPRIAYINTTMHVLPADAGWGGMADLPTHFYEYNSMDADGNAIDLSKRQNSPSSTNTYVPVLTADQAARFTVENVLGGTDSWLPTEETAVSAAPEVRMEGSKLVWDDMADARCYVVLKDGQYLANTTATEFDLVADGSYTVRPANANGGLGEESDAVNFVNTVVATGATGWATACLSYDAAVPAGTKAYYISGVQADCVVLKELAEIPAGEGFIFNAVQGEYTFGKAAAAPAAIVNMLTGTLEDITVEPETIYVLGKISDTAVGMMLYTGTTLAAGKAYMPKPADGARQAYSFVIDTPNGIAGVADADADANRTVYNLHGQRVGEMQQGRIYIVNGKKVLK